MVDQVRSARRVSTGRATRRDVLRTGAALGACSMLGSGCAPPFQVIERRATPGRRADVLVVFLAGYSDDVQDVVNHGVAEVIAEHAPPVDMVVVQHETPQFFSGQFIESFQQRVVGRPWFDRYAQRVLVGFSAGSTAALAYAAGGHATNFDAMVLYAPYLGPGFIIEEIDEAGGLASWEPTGPREDQEDLWVWLRRYGAGEVTEPPTWLLWSREDEVAVGLAQLEAHLPPERMIVGHGEHGWLAFDQIWTGFVREHAAVFRAR